MRWPLAERILVGTFRGRSFNFMVSATPWSMKLELAPLSTSAGMVTFPMLIWTYRMGDMAKTCSAGPRSGDANPASGTSFAQATCGGGDTLEKTMA